MYILNSGLYKHPNIYDFVDASVNVLLSRCPGLKFQKEYWLFYYIKEDFLANWMSLSGYNVEMDIFGFGYIKRNTRHIIEAFLDLSNLSSDSDYIEVLKYCDKKTDCNIERFKDYRCNGQFTIQSKINIAKRYGKDFQKFIGITNECNRYVHPNVFIDLSAISNIDVKRDILENLLQVNLYVYDAAFKILLNKYNGGQYVALSCAGCSYYNCAKCHDDIYKNMNEIIDKQLLSYVPPQGYNYYMPF